MKIDNNPFAKGFRETGQSKCKRKMMSSSSPLIIHLSSSSSSSSTASSSGTLTNTEESDDCLSKSEDDRSSVSSFDSPLQQKRLRALEYPTEEDSFSPFKRSSVSYEEFMQNRFTSPIPSYYPPPQQQQHLMQQHLQSLIMDPLRYGLPMPAAGSMYHSKASEEQTKQNISSIPTSSSSSSSSSSPTASSSSAIETPAPVSLSPSKQVQNSKPKRNNFSISAILAY
ncbi:hypothetical protein DOY81_008204 [Sarcophaga bullata]|nr:hypothetical protein DOY81_008204 [Sarcophaga bullata]